MNVIAAFQGLSDKNQLQLIYNEETVQLLESLKVPEKDKISLAEIFHLRFERILYFL